MYFEIVNLFYNVQTYTSLTRNSVVGLDDEATCTIDFALNVYIYSINVS